MIARLSVTNLSRWPGAAITLAFVQLLGCGNTPIPSGGSADNDPLLDAPSLFPINRKALDDASDTFLSLLDTRTATDARAELVDHLPNHDAIARAELCSDGYTIWVDFADGQLAAIHTDDVFAMAEVEAKAVPRMAHSRGEGESPVSKASPNTSRTLRALPEGLVHTPQSRKVLLMSAASETFLGRDLAHFENIRDTLVNDYNWEARDITIKRNEFSESYSTLDFYDFFRLEDYGVIVILAHGIFRDGPPEPPVVTPSPTVPPAPTPAPSDDSDPFDFGFRVATGESRYSYIQVATERADPIDPDPFDFGFRVASEMDFDVTQEMRRGRIILVEQVDTFKKSHRTYYYMREDLWAEYMGDLPSSFVYVCTPNKFREPEVLVPPPVVTVPPAPTPGPHDEGDPFNFGFRIIGDRSSAQAKTSVMYARGAGSVLGWDHLVWGVDALNAVNIVAEMARDDLSDVESLESGAFETSVFVTDLGFEDWEAKLTLFPYHEGTRRHLFLPTWADVGATGYPDDTVTIRVSVSYSDEAVPLPAVAQYQDIPHSPNTFEGLIPGQEAIFTLQALNRLDEVLGETEERMVLRTGGNTVVADFTYNVPNRFLMFEGYDTDPTARNETWSWSYYLAWDDVPGATYYDVTITRNGRYLYDGQEEVTVQREIQGQSLAWAPAGYVPGTMVSSLAGYTYYYKEEIEAQPSAEALEKRANEIAIIQTWSFNIQPYFPEE